MRTAARVVSCTLGVATLLLCTYLWGAGAMKLFDDAFPAGLCLSATTAATFGLAFLAALAQAKTFLAKRVLPLAALVIALGIASVVLTPSEGGRSDVDQHLVLYFGLFPTVLGVVMVVVASWIVPARPLESAT